VRAVTLQEASSGIDSPQRHRDPRGAQRVVVLCVLRVSVVSQYRRRRRTMAVSTAIASVEDVRAFIDEYFEAWSGTDEDLILSYYFQARS
jgi:hypothetical protein